MKKRKEVFETLNQILLCYESYRNILKLTQDKAIKKTLDTYSDFYEWLGDRK